MCFRMALFFILNEERRTRRIQRSRLRDLANPFELSDREFYHNYRLNKPMALYMCRELEGELAPLQNHGHPVHIKVLTAIKFMAGGSYLREVGQDHNLCIGQRTASDYLDEVVTAINHRLKPMWIGFPVTEDQRRRVVQGYQDKFGLPNVLGTIDCTHVSIFPPPRPYGIQYKNRHGYYSINVQLIADADCKILQVNAQYPGRVHDQFIFNNSIVKPEMRRLYQQRVGIYFLLGDSGYGLEPWLMTPILNAELGSPEDRYTKWHCRARNTIERTNGYLKGSLRCLGCDRSLHYSPEKSCSLIYACCTIYNMMKHFRVEMENINEERVDLEGEPEDPENNGAVFNAALQRRHNIVQQYFN